jgi:hypothetical protein
LIFLGLLAVYCSNLRVLASGDSLPTRVLPFSILREGNLDLNEFTWERTRNGRLPYYLRGTGKHLYPMSPIATPLVITPLYVVPAWLLVHYNISYDDVRARVLIAVMERLSAAILTALSALLVFLMLDRLVSRNWAVALTPSMGWAHPPGASRARRCAARSRALALSVLCWVFDAGTRAAELRARRSRRRAGGRQSTADDRLRRARTSIWRGNRARPCLRRDPALGSAALLAYNLSVFGAVAGVQQVNLFPSTVLEGIAGLLVSPNAGCSSTRRS